MFKHAALAGIYGYQRWISPRKGFRCAYSVRHGGTGCSGYAKHAIRDHGLWRAVPLIRARFEDCKTAAQAFAAERGESEEDRKKRRADRRDGCVTCGDAACAVPLGCGFGSAASGATRDPGDGSACDVNPCDGDIGCSGCDACNVDICSCS